MTLQEILYLFKTHTSWWVAALICLSLLIEITPIKINPLSWLAKKIGKAFNGEVMKEIGTLKTEVEGIKQDVTDIREEAKEREATNRRNRILEFGDEILHGVQYSKEHWDNILTDIGLYETYCDKHPHYMNSVAEATIKHIKTIYQKCLYEDGFL